MQPSFIPPSRLPPWRIPPADSRPSPPPPAPRSSYLRPRPRPGDEQDMQRPSPPFVPATTSSCSGRSLAFPARILASAPHLTYIRPSLATREEEEREAEGVWERVLEEEWELRRTRRRRDAELTGLVKEVEGGEEGEVWEVSWEGREGNDEDPLKRVANRASSRFRPGSPTWPTAPAIPLPPVDRPAATSAVYTSSYLSRFSTSPSLPRTSLPLFPSAAHLPDPASECEQRLSPSPAQSSADFVPFSHSSPPSPPRIARNCHEVSFDKPMKPSSISITGGGSNSLPAFLQPGFLSRPPASPSRPGSGFVPSSSSAFDLLFRFKSGLVGLSVVAFSSLPTPSHPSPTPLPRPPLSPWPVNPVQAEPVSPLKDALGGEDAAMAAVEKSQGADRAHGSA
ncbi:hypothetical protein JCM11251_006176 [Rhodosporidiobolus azoricus]